MSKNSKKQAIIIGASMAGLLAARVCANHFEKVIIVEKDPLGDSPNNRRGVPQDHQLHILLSKGMEIINHYFPGIEAKLKEKGAIIGDLGEKMKWYGDGGYRPVCATQVRTAFMSRPLLEYTVRHELNRRKNIEILSKTDFDKFIIRDGVVKGISTSNGDLFGQLTIDARGFASRLPMELTKSGYTPPREEKVKVNVHYTSCLFPREESYETLVNINANPPFHSKHGTLQPLEDNKMIVMVQGRNADTVPADLEAFKNYTKSLDAPDIYEKIRNINPVGSLYKYKIPYVRWHHFEELKAFPEGLLPIGDSICRLNPVYGQGMTSAALQAQTLDKLLARYQKKIWKQYFKKVSKIIKAPWDITIGEDFKFPETEGTPPSVPSFMVRYFDRLVRVMNNDPVIYQPFMEVLNMKKRQLYS